MIWKTILVPHDFSSPANHACALARDEAKVHGGTLMLLHVVELPMQLAPDTALMPDQTGAPISVRDYAVKAAQQHLDDIAARLAKDGVTAQIFVKLGKPAEEILAFADDKQVDVIVMGTHGRTGLAHLIAGSVTEKVVRTSKWPVLTVPGHEHGN